MNRGFTLLDLLLVMLILGIMGMIIIPQLHSMANEAKLNGAATELVSALEYAANLAVQYQRPFGLKADDSGNWFRVFDNRYKSDSNPHTDEDPPVDAYGVVLNPVDKTWYTRDYDTLGTYEGVRLTSVPAGGEILFYPDGHSASSDNTFVVSLSDSQRTITVNGTTGRVTVD